MFSFHKPKVYRSSSGCCICKAKSSSSRFTDSKKYEEDFVECFQLEEHRAGEVCNACVLLVKRWKKLPPGTQRHWRHVVDARAGPGTKSFVKIKSRKNIKPKIKSKKHIDEEEMEDEPKKVFENDVGEFEINDISGENEPLSDPLSPRCTIDDEEDINLCVRSRKKVTSRLEISPFLDLKFWKPEKVCCGVIFKSAHGQVIVDPRFMKPCMFKRDSHKPVAVTDTATKLYSDNSSDSGYDESSNPGEVPQSSINNN